MLTSLSNQMKILDDICISKGIATLWLARIFISLESKEIPEFHLI